MPTPEIPGYLRVVDYHSQVAHELRDIVQRLTWHATNVTVSADLLRRVFNRLIELEDGQ